MNITFFGLKSTFDYYRTGGMDSFYRRVANILIQDGHHVRFLLYQNDAFKAVVIQPNFEQIYCETFNDALDFLNKVDGPIIVNAIHRNDRLQFIKYRKNHPDRRFHLVYSVYSEDLIRRNLYLLESFIFPYNGIGICFSLRLAKALKLRRNKSTVFLPPVPDYYFLKPDMKRDSDAVNITYLGRIDPGKGILDFIEIARHFRKDASFQFKIYGYLWPYSSACTEAYKLLKKQEFIHYEISELDAWTPQAEKRIADILINTHILILPYKRLSSTTDTPVLLLEGMASACCILTRPLGNIPEIYGHTSPFLINSKNFIEESVRLINRSHAIIASERRRVTERIKNLLVDENGTAQRIKLILNNQEVPYFPS